MAIPRDKASNNPSAAAPDPLGAAPKAPDTGGKASPGDGRKGRKSNFYWPPSSRAKDITYYPYFKGAISRWGWRFLHYRMTPASRWLLCLTIVYTLFGSNSLEVQLYVPFPYLFWLWMVAIVGAHLYRPRIALTAHHTDRICTGETLPIDLQVQQLRSLAAAEITLIPHRLPPALDLVPDEGALLQLPEKGQTVRVRLGLRCTQRGIHHWKGFRAETDFPFGLLRSYRVYEKAHSVMVYPRFTRLARLRIPSGRRYQPGGVALASNLGESFEYIGNREYREGDNIRDIDWRATARLNLPIVREYREEYFLRVGVILDTYVPKRAPEAERDNFERAVSVSAAVSDFMARSDYLVDIFAAGPNLYHLTAGRSLAYLDQILEILACVESNPEEPFAVLEPELMESLAQITTVVCVFLDWNEARRDFVQKLRREGAGLKVILVRDAPCTLPPEDADLPDEIVVLSKEAFEAGIEEI
ncbi:MAG TPA: DUF58 domain-containing protein [Chthonomonadaceae bacterium]|nr:DUF58 domain-containing protein [Chthonomonadaceae bacterium]